MNCKKTNIAEIRHFIFRISENRSRLLQTESNKVFTSRSGRVAENLMSKIKIFLLPFPRDFFDFSHFQKPEKVSINSHTTIYDSKQIQRNKKTDNIEIG